MAGDPVPGSGTDPPGERFDRYMERCLYGPDGFYATDGSAGRRGGDFITCPEVGPLFGAVLAPASIVSFALPVMVGVTILCFFVLQEREMTRWDGWLLLILYAGFNLQLFRVG